MSDNEEFDDGTLDAEGLLEELEEEEALPPPPDDDEEGSESSDSDGGDVPAPMREEELNDIDRRASSMEEKAILIVRAENRRTATRLSVSELSRVISIRAEQIENGEHIFTEAGDETTPNAIAEKELREGRCPLNIHRTVGRGPRGEQVQEVFRVRELALPPQFSQ